MKISPPSEIDLLIKLIQIYGDTFVFDEILKEFKTLKEAKK